VTSEVRCKIQVIRKGGVMAKPLKLHSKGEVVTRVQKALLKLGYVLPKYGADGDLGYETIAALQDFAFEHGRDEDSLPNEHEPIEGALIDELLELAALKKTPKPQGVELVDATTMHQGQHVKGVRAWGEIDGITLHQTGIYMNSTVKRFLRLRAHMGIIDPGGRGTVVLVNPLTAYMWHAQELNAKTVGIEINGLFEGVDGKGLPKKDRHKKLCRASDAQILATRKGMEWICKEVAKHGGQVRYVYAHRQSSENRRSDPGSRVWQEVALWAESNLGLETHPDYTVGTGRAIPEAWDPRQVGVKY
jgi:peptidoglycan hydrolase-like protein with peptidoglycan-binding domain